MAFILNEEERTPYGTPVLKRIDNAGTVDGLCQAVETLNKSAGGKAFTWIMGDGRPVGIRSVTAGPDGLVLDTTQAGEMPPPVPALHFVHGLQSEAHGNGGQRMFVKFCDGETVLVKSARLEMLDENDPTYVITIETGEAVKAVTAKDAEVAAPRNSDDFEKQLARLVRASRRPNLAKEPLLCHIPSVENRYAKDRVEAQQVGTMCVVDIVLKKNEHLELELMSVSPGEAQAMQENPGEQSAESVATQCTDLGAGLPLFFMYKGVPYAASDFAAKDGMPPVLTLEPWADVLESQEAGEIQALASRSAADGLV